MRKRPLYRLLLITALAFGQWLMIAHDYQHPALDGNDQTCQFCLHVQNLQAGPASTPTLGNNWLSSEAPSAVQIVRVQNYRYTLASIRAPPALLV